MGAATITRTFDLLVEWVEKEVAPQLDYLLPSEGHVVEGQELAYVHPAVYANFVPTDGRLQEGSYRFPFIAVQLVNGRDGLGSTRSLSVRIVLGIWVPGHFNNGEFADSMDGWRDLFNGLDLIVRSLQEAETVADARIDTDAGISYGFFGEEDGVVIDQYPYFMGRVDFTLECGAQPGSKRFENLL